MSKVLPKYPVYIVSKGRWANPLTAKFLAKDAVPFKIVVEPQEEEQYVAAVGKDRVLVLPFSNLGLGSIPARNWIWEHAKATGAFRHWILDDNMRCIRRMWKQYRIPAEAGIGLRVAEDFIDRYENVAIGGLAYQMFVVPHQPPFFLNVHVYSCILIRNDLPYRWRGRYNEDTDLSLQVLADGWCTVLINAFMVDKVTTLKMKGGNTDQLYAGDGRLDMARALERQWPGVVRVARRYGRAQHTLDWTKHKPSDPGLLDFAQDAVDVDWKKFKDNKLVRKPEFADLPTEANEYGLKLSQVGEKIKSPTMRKLLRDANKR